MSLKKYIEQEFYVHKLVVKLLKQLLEKNFKPTRINCAVDIKFDPYFKKKKPCVGLFCSASSRNLYLAGKSTQAQAETSEDGSQNLPAPSRSG